MSAFALAKRGIPAVTLVAIASLAACGGGGGGSSAAPPSNNLATNSPATSPPVSTQQVVSMALPSAIGQVTDPTWGAIGGYTQGTASQVLAFAPGAQIMLKNLASNLQHTLNVIASGVTPGTGFPANPTLSFVAAGGSTIGTGFASGTLNGGQLAGPFTLAQGTYFIGCAFHYISNGMRDVLIVQAGATPGPTSGSPSGPPSGPTPTPVPGGGVY